MQFIITKDLLDWLKMRQDAGLDQDIMACLKECQAKISEQAATITDQEWKLAELARKYTLTCGNLNKEILELRAAVKTESKKAESKDDHLICEILALRARLSIVTDWETLCRQARVELRHAEAKIEEKQSTIDALVKEGYKVDTMLQVAQRSIARQGLVCKELSAEDRLAALEDRVTTLEKDN